MSGTNAIHGIVIVGALELNALKGKTGPMTTVKGVITSGFVLAAVLYAVVEAMIRI
jgi:F0F1-type ATP synthase membrane subunit c/vacuolar-type H+-ATPase subunit K